MAKVLFCTVGGSFQPILKAIEAHRPDRVVFICSEDDPASGKKGSYTEVIGEGKVCSSRYPEPPDLPNIPTQAGLSQEQFDPSRDLVRIPADDPEAIIVKSREILLAALEIFSEVIADYTGGTKSMSGGLMMAAIHTKGVKLSLIGGARTNLVKVSDGMQAMRHVNVARVRSMMHLDAVKNAWGRHAYDEAAQLLEDTGSSDPDLHRVLVLSRGFAAWDRYDHTRAHQLLSPYGAFLPGRLLAALGALKYDELSAIDAAEEKAREAQIELQAAYAPQINNLRKTRAYKLWDLYLNSARRAKAGQYDAAVLLLYRLFEGIAQSSLFFDHMIKSDDAPAEIAIKYSHLVQKGRDGNYVIGNHNAWNLLAELGENELAEVGRATRKSRLEFLHRRNQSLYAHGFEPINRAEYQKSRDFFDGSVKNAFLSTYFKGEVPFKQLPTAF